MAEIWNHIQLALSDVPILSAEISQLRTELDETRLDRANLLAAARATIAAHHDGEPDPLSYLRDELAARGQLPPGPGRLL
jgi:DNA-binding XRE family transcriptional regulator